MNPKSNRSFASYIPFLMGSLILVSLGGCSPKNNPVTTAAVTTKPEVTVGPKFFEDVTKQTGINLTYRNGEEAEHYAIIESLGGGVAVFDYDQDGKMDLFFPIGGYYEGKTVLGHPCKLYRNLGDFRFEDVTEKVGFKDIKWCYTHGATSADYDCDGWPDLLVSGYNRVQLFRNVANPKGGRQFVEVTQQAGIQVQKWSTSTAWADLDGDGFPEFYVCHYGDWGFDTNHPMDCMYDGKTRDVCQPRRFSPLSHTLYKNKGDGTFVDISEELKTQHLGRGIGVIMVDVNDDQRPDIYVANDVSNNHLYMNRGKPGQAIQLEEKGKFAGVATDDRGVENGSMGLDASSHDRSGVPSILVTNYENELPALYLNRSNKTREMFNYATSMAGIGVIGGNYVSWGTGFLDIENRGWEDLIIVNGHAIRFPSSKFGRQQKSVLFRNESGKFKVNTLQGGEYFEQLHNARGIGFGDLNNDGKMDMVISHLNEPVVILKNISENKNHWVGLNLKRLQNKDLVGTKVELTANGETQYRFGKSGNTYGSSADPRFLFGIGSAEKIDKITVHWPNGQKQEWTDLKIDQYCDLVEGTKESSPTKTAKE